MERKVPCEEFEQKKAVKKDGDSSKDFTNDESQNFCSGRDSEEKHGARQSQKENSKRLKLSKDVLYKPPTSQELNSLQETENLYHSSLFRLQVEELLAEVKVKQKRSINDWIVNLKSFLLALPEEKSRAINDQEWINGLTVKLPIHQKPFKANGIFRFLPPSNVHIVGAYPLGLSCKPSVTVDVAILIPKGCFHHVDYLNCRYHLKRSMYLMCLAQKLEKEDFISEVKYTYFHGDHLKPVLLIIPNGKLSKKVMFSIFPYPPQNVFLFRRFIPNQNNVRPSWFFQQNKESDNIPTPRYNSSLLVDLTLEQNFNYVSNALNGADTIKDGIILLKVWAHQRQLDKGFGAFSPFIQTMYVVHLLHSKKLNTLMSSYQVVRTAWLHLAQSDWTHKGVSLSQTITVHQPTLEDFHASFETVFVDTVGFQNICAHMSTATFNRLQYEAAKAVKFLDDKSHDSFSALFMTPAPFITTFDHVLHITNIAQAQDKLNFSPYLLDNVGCMDISILKMLVDLLKNGLGKRIQLLDVQLKDPPTWSVFGSPPVEDSVTKITIGFLLDSTLSSSLLDKGPSADSSEALSFREFWGEKSELRRFQDGSICEAVVWPGSTVADKRMVCKHIVHHILFRHLSIPESDIIYIGHELDTIISSPGTNIVFGMSETSGYETGEERMAAALQAFDKLTKHLRQLDVVLSINSVQGISPLFRYTEVFPSSPIFGRINKTLTAIDNKHLILKSNSYSSPHWNKPFEAIIMLESSGKWPDHVEAIRRLKAAFHLNLSNLLEKQFCLKCAPQTDYLDVLADGYVFRLRVASQREIIALKTIKTPMGTTKIENTEQSLTLEAATNILPKITSAIHGLQMQHGSYSSTCQLAKRWVSAQLLLDHVSDVCIDLIVAHLFLSSLPYTTPSCPQVGFVRFLQLVSKFDWKSRPLIVNFNNDMIPEDIAEIQTCFIASRQNFPAMYVVTPYDKFSSYFVRSRPTLQILHRLVLLAGEAQAVLEAQLANPLKTFDYKSIFRPPLEPYDVIIHLNPRHVQSIKQGVDVEVCRRTPSNVKEDELEHSVLPIIDYSLVSSYLKELRESCGEFALFFYDHYGGKYIAVLWKPMAFEPQPFKVTNVNCRMVSERSTDENVLLIPNVTALIEEFSNLGQGIVQRIETKTHKWTFMD